MRITLPGGDVEVPLGLSVGQARSVLARVTRDPRVAEEPWWVDGRRLDDDHVAGTTPWVHGARVHLGPAPPTGSSLYDSAVRAAASPWHLAVLDGPDAGLVAAPGDRGEIRVGREVAGLRLSDPLVSRRHLEVTRRPRLGSIRSGGATGSSPAARSASAVGSSGAADSADAARWHLRDLGSANGTAVLRPRRRRPGLGDLRSAASAARRVGRRPRALRAGDRIVVGSTTLELRATPARPPSDVLPARSAGPDGTTTAAGRAAAEHRGTGEGDAGQPGRAPVSAWLLPALMSLGMAVTLGQPMFALLALAGPLAAVLPAALRRRRRPAAAPSPPGLAPDAARTAVDLAAGRAGLASSCSWVELAADGLAVVGPADHTRAVARGLLGAALAASDTALSLLHPVGATQDWSWCRWLGRRLGGDVGARVARDAAGAAEVLTRTPSAPHLLVSDHGLPWRASLHRWWSTRSAGDAALLLESDVGAVPGWCRWVLTITPASTERGLDAGAEAGRRPRAADRAGAGVATLTGPGVREPVAVLAGSLAWAEELSRRLPSDGGRQAGHGAVGAEEPSGDPGTTERPTTARGGRTALPDRIGLADLALPGTVAEVLQTWDPGRWSATPRPCLDTPIGIGPAGPVTIDLMRDGPHALVAGTTGAGKSELLQSMVLGLALRHPPTRLAVVLVDYKGGTSFGHCRDLPHVVGQVTDLDATEAGRALAGLRAELRRRKRLLADAGLGDLETLRSASAGSAPPRLLVVVDEFRAMTEELPDFVPDLVRIAAQGRSLGIHLVLATQRPAGAVTAQMRANVSLRLCLRVTDDADSADVVEVPHAADLPVDLPGRAVLRRGPAAPQTVQTAWAALPRGVEDQPHAALPWSAFGPHQADSSRQADDGARHHGDALDHGSTLVRLCREATEAAGLPVVDPPWLPALPPVLTAAELASGVGERSTGSGTTGVGPAFGLLDLPQEQRRALARWSGRGLLVVTGRPGSGRTTALATVAQAAAADGREVHVVHGSPEPRVDSLDIALGELAVGTAVGPEDPRRLARLLSLLTGTTPRGHRPGAGPVLVVDDLAAVQRSLDLLPRGAGDGLIDRLLRGTGQHGTAVVVSGAPGDVVKALPHASARLVLAVNDPHDAALLGVPAGQAATLRLPGQAMLVDAAGSHRCQVALPPPRHHMSRAVPGSAVLRLRPIPLQVDLADVELPDDVVAARADPLSVPLGLGGDNGGPVEAPMAGGVLVVGPPGSGRTTALAVLARGLRHRGWVVTDGVTEEPEPPHALVVDDLDVLLRADPALDDRLAGWLQGPRAPLVVAGCRTDRAAAAYRGVLATMRAGTCLVLQPMTPGAQEVAGVDLGPAVDPVHPEHPGRGVLVHRGRLTPVQVAVTPRGPVPDGS